MAEEPRSRGEHRPPELLAPAGQMESFLAAVEHGANAVYLGLKQLSARASATNFSLEELARILPYAHKRKVSVYVALNSIVTASEFPAILDLLQSLHELKVDALIVQDPGIFFLARNFFPSLKLHASTLMTIHNSAGVNQLERMGARRVVLARELNLNEIREIADRTRVDLEIFVHGALCYSYSGLCLASSFRGGHSGLQGRCVQPCRLRFKQGKAEGFFLSCNDLCALPLVPELKKLRVAAFKIEGRMKSADYIAQVVRAYRLVIDAPPENEEDVLKEARELLARSPSRRLTSGCLGENANREVLSPHRSGSSGQWVATVTRVEGDRALVRLRHDLSPGDRLRPESSEGKEKRAFSVTEILSKKGEALRLGRAGEKVLLACKADVQRDDRLIRVGVREPSPEVSRRRTLDDTSPVVSFGRKFPHPENLEAVLHQRISTAQKEGETLIVKVARAGDLVEALDSPARWVLLTATRSNLERLARQRLGGAQKRRFAWSLPPVIAEKDDHYFRLAVRWYCERGFSAWELNNWGHFDLFEKHRSLTLMSGYRFNVRNAAALGELAEAGCRGSVLSLEITREELRALGAGSLGAVCIATLYSWPPLFTSRLLPKINERKPFRTPREETYYYEKRGENALVFADRPVSWLDHLPALRSYGFRNFSLDLSDGPTDQLPGLWELLRGFRESRAAQPFSLFNLERRPR